MKPKKRNRLLFIFMILSLLIISNNIQAQELTFSQKEQLLKQLSPTQKELLEKKLSSSGGGLTLKNLESLKKNPEFKGLKPEEIIQGQKLLRKQKAQSGSSSKKFSKSNTQGIKSGFSLFEKYWKMKESGRLEVSTKIKPFGYNLFQRILEKPLPAQPVAPDYIIGPGDEIQVLLWGRINDQFTLTVGNDGRILFPQIGPLSVAGMTYEEMKKFLTQQVKRITGTEVSISLASLRQIQVFVLGEVKNPGPYNLTAMSTMLDALIAAGGPTERGSLRKIILKRKQKVISCLDLYDLLLKGDKSHDKRLRHGDIIFVPLAGPLVGIAGNVKRPAIYELKGSTSLKKLLDLAGGLLPVAWKQKIQVERIKDHAWKVVLDINALELKTIKEFKLKDGDLVKVFSVPPKIINKVELHGNVVRPGTYAYHPGMKLSEIISSPKDLLPDTYFDYALIKRFVYPTGEIELVPFNLGNIVLKKKEDIELKPLDRIYIFSKWTFEEMPTVSIKGEIRSPGNYMIKEEGFRVKDLIFLARGLKKDAYLKRAELYRLDKKDKKRILILVDLKKALEGDPQNNVLLQDGDELVVHSIWEYIPKRTVFIYGEVNHPGEYPYVSGMRVKDLILAAGNLKESAYLKKAEITSYKIKEGELCQIKHKTINLKKALAGDPQNNVLLRPYDKLFIKTIPDWGKIEYVEIEGEVLFPGRYIIKKGERLSSVLKRAGGFTPDAYLKGAVFTRKSLQELQQRKLQEMIERLEKELMGKGVAETGAAITPQEAEISIKEMEAKKQFLAKLKSIKAKGRLVIHLKPLSEFEGSIYDIELENGDKIFIPRNPSTIQVVGAVYNQSSFIFKPQAGLSYYIDLAGGYTKSADKGEVYILKVDGTAIKAHKGLLSLYWNPKEHRWESGPYANLEPGDTIVIPEKLERIAWMRNVKDLTQILYQIAVTAGVIIAAY